MKEVLNEHALLDKGMAGSSTQMPQTHGSSKAFQDEAESNGKTLLCPSMNADCAEYDHHHIFPLNVYGLNIAFLQRLFPPRVPKPPALFNCV